jgi:hypothetical protein
MRTVIATTSTSTSMVHPVDFSRPVPNVPQAFPQVMDAMV